VTKRSHTYAV